MNRVSVTASSLLICVVSGCATYEPKPLDTGAELAAIKGQDLAQFVIEHDRPGQRREDDHAAFDVSNGFSELELVAVALTLNPELKARRASIGESQALLISAGMWPNPVLGVGVGPGVSGASGTALSANLLFELLRIGERDALKKIATAKADETKNAVIGDEFKLVADVRTQRLAVLATERVMALLNEAQDLRQRGLDLVQRQRELGEANALAVSASEFGLAEIRRDLRQARVTFDADRRVLNRLLGLPSNYDLKLSELGSPLAITVTSDLSDDELDERILNGRVELRGAMAAYERSEEELRLAVLQQYPRLGIGPNFEQDVSGDKSLGLSLSLELPVLNQNQGEIATKQAARQRAKDEYIALLHRIRAEAFEARAAVRAASAEIAAQDKEILPLIQRNQELFEGAYRAREINVVDWLTSQQRSLDARREYIDTLVRYRKAVIQLDATTGSSPAASGTPSTPPSTSKTKDSQ